jgi:superfamily II DNA helicase RecQ
MGIDVPDVRLVIHWGMPASPSDYAQEVGRAGRDRRAAVAVLLSRTDDVKLQLFMLQKSLTAEGTRSPDWDPEEYLRRRQAEVDVMDGMATARNRCFRKLLNEHFGSHVPAARQPFTVRLLRWLYGARAVAPQEGWCCDACSSRAGKDVVDVAAAVLGSERRRSGLMGIVAVLMRQSRPQQV